MTLQRILLPHLAIFHLKRTWGWYRGLQGPLSLAFHTQLRSLLVVWKAGSLQIAEASVF